jgi:hypothetical protein
MMFGSAKLLCRRAFDRLRSTVKQRITRAVLTRAIPSSTKRLIIFLTPGYEFTAGGVMAITAMYQESVAQGQIHQAKVVLCTVPGEPPLLKYTWFQNRNYLLGLEAVLKRCGPLEYLLLHIPDYEVNQVLDWLSTSATLLQNVKELHLNVLLFNIDIIQGQNVRGLTRFGKVTCTTAHEAYSDLATREAMGVSLHRLLICKGPEFYSPTGYQDKEPLLIVSPDAHPLKELVLQKIAKELPDLRIQVIRDLSYEDYTRLIRRAKWSLTFGEGLDGFFVETVFSGGVSFAVFNERFFTPAFTKLETIYPSWTALVERIAEDLQRLDEPAIYNRCWRQAHDLLSYHLDTERFRENLRMFYRGEYTFP